MNYNRLNNMHCFSRLCRSRIPRRAAVMLIEPPLRVTIPFLGLCKPWRYASALMLALLSLVAGCATVPPATSQERGKATSFAPHPEYAGVYIFRPLDLLTGEGLKEVSLDHVSVGELGNKSFLYLPVAPGKHCCWIWDVQPGEHGTSHWVRSLEWEWAAAQKFTAEAGKNYFFVISQPLLYGRKLKSITEGEGKAYAKEFTLSSLCGPGWAAQFAAAQGGQASFVYDNVMPVMPVMPVNRGVYASPPTIRFWAPRGGIGVIQAGLMNNWGRIR